MILNLLGKLELFLGQWLGDSTVALIVTHFIAAITALIVFGIVYRLVSKFFIRIAQRLEDARGNRNYSLRIQQQEILSSENVTHILIGISRFTSIILRILIIFFLFNTILSLFDTTRELAGRVSGAIIGVVFGLAKGFIDYVPDLAVVIVIAFLSVMLMRLLRLFFHGIATQHIVIPGFYPEWAHTTMNLLKILIIALTVVVVFPYLPGSDSPAFQGVSIFFGVLFSLGSTSAVANVVAGIVITYTRAFKVGDRVRINDTEGKVVERSSFVTRILTPKKVEVSIPNATVMNSHIINYSTQVVNDKGVILHTTITIGYDITWQQVHKLLLAAASQTAKVELDPKPYVLQTALDDNYVAYELNVTTKYPNEMAIIYSDLHANILDSFHQAGVEIMSPHYRAMRDGSDITIPETAPIGNEV